MTIGKRLKEERERLSLTQPELGAFGGAGKTTVIAWERGTAFPNAAFLAAIAAVGADVRYIVTGERDGPPPLKPEEQLLLERYRTSATALRNAALRVLLDGVSPTPTGGQHIHGKVGQVTKTGDIVNNAGRRKK